ncbi:PE-PPE domain-containing protein [Mycolicibacterium gadium]|jgi:hypothetical protein|uniref:PE-PPE domain-containing protein n=1 Tax=Mycolicibacterium gadium TaxID=1794 RepID=UPI002FDEAAE9
MAKFGRKHAVRVAIGTAAIGVATSVTAVAVTQPASISATLVDLTALIVVGSSTNPSGEGVVDFFDGKFNNSIYTGDDPQNPDIVYVNFWEGPAGIRRAIVDANGRLVGDQRNAVVASGWGAANASLLLLRNDPDLSNTRFILDNDVARPDGGFGTRYPWFALIGVNPIPTPSDVPTGGVTVVNTGYEYDYNSNAPGYVLNPFSAVNSLAAYLTTRLNQAEIELPVNADGSPIDPNGDPLECGGANTCALTENDAVLPCPDARCIAPVGDRITAYVTTRNDTTYVTYTTRELPLTTLIRNVFGEYIADVSAPLLKWAVDFGYYGGNPIPSDPSAYRPARFIPAIGDMLTALGKLPGVIVETLAAIVAPFLPRHAAPTQPVTTRMLPEEPESGQQPKDLTQALSTGEGSELQTSEGLGAPTNEDSSEEVNTEELNSEEFDTVGRSTGGQETTAQQLTTEHTSTPLMNVLRNSLRALPGQPIITPGDDDSSETTEPESVESEQNSEPQQPIGPLTIGDVATNAEPDGDNSDDSANSDADATAP